MIPLNRADINILELDDQSLVYLNTKLPELAEQAWLDGKSAYWYLGSAHLRDILKHKHNFSGLCNTLALLTNSTHFDVELAVADAVKQTFAVFIVYRLYTRNK